MSGLIVGLESGGTKLQAALGRPDGEILACRRGTVPAGTAAAILEWFEREVPEVLKEAPSHGGEVKRIGVGFGGPVDSVTGTALTSHQVEGWSGFALKPWFEERFGIETRVFNDSNAAGWAEYCLGAGRGTRHFMYSNIGSGIGGALIIDGRLHDGQGRGAGRRGVAVLNLEQLDLTAHGLQGRGDRVVAGVAGGVRELRDHDRRQNTQNDHHDQNFD